MAKPKIHKRTKQDTKSAAAPGTSSLFKSRLTAIRAFFQAEEVWGILALSLVLFALVIYFYPFPATFSDSGDYIFRAKKQTPGVFRPFGYSWFLMQLHTVVQSARGLTVTQLILHVAALIYFVRAVLNYFPTLSRVYRWALIVLLALSPLHMYLVNSILSDSLFCSLSIIWLASGMYLVKRLQWIHLLVHLIALFLAMKIRYIGVIYPAVTAIIFILGDRRIWQKVALVLVPIVLVGFFYTSTTKFMHKRFGVNTFSGFGGWQLANNAMHTFPYFEIKPEAIPDQKVREIYAFIQLYGDTIYPPPGVTTTSFMWENKSPLKQYFLRTIAAEKPMWLYGNKWLYAGVRYGEFGNYFIRQHPDLYFRHFVLPNLKDVIYPPLGFVENYLENKQGEETCIWFGLPKESVMAPRQQFYKNSINGWLPAFHAALALSGIALLLLALFFRNRFRLDRVQWRIVAIWIAFAGILALFSAYASTVEIRYVAPLYAAQVALLVIVLGSFTNHRTSV